MKENQGSLTESERRELARQNIHQCRLLSSLSQAELAKLAGVSMHTVFRAEAGRPVRVRSLKKICSALRLDYEWLTSKSYLNIKSDSQPFCLNQPKDTRWYGSNDKRTKVPAENLAMLQDPKERQRLGRTGLVSAFASSFSFAMAEGPGMVMFELYGRYEGTINFEIYRHCLFYCSRGEVKFKAEGEEVFLSEGSLLGFDTDLNFSMEPLKPVGPTELPPIMIWIGANRRGKMEIGRRVRVSRQTSKRAKEHIS